jgi:steroid delta-isomerase-like uncharacterized protein
MVTMSNETKMLERLFDEAWSEGNLEVVDELITDEYVLDEPTFEGEVRGPDGLNRAIRTFRDAFPDLELAIDHRVSGAHDVVDGVLIRGTHEGDFLGLAPTGKQVEVRGLMIHRFRDGELIEDYASWDFLGMLRVLGATEAPTIRLDRKAAE